MPRRIALLVSLALMACAAPALAGKPLDDACQSSSPNASICIGGQKVAEAAAAVCRSTAAPNTACLNSVMAHDVDTAALAAYKTSWLHRTAEYQYALGDSVPLVDAQWLGTHNSFNTDSNGVTLSHTDNNQQLTLTQQLDGDIRAIELDVHQVPGPDNGLGSDEVRVCHGRGADEFHAGCTNEKQLKDVLPEIRTWTNAHPTQVLMVYLEDNLENDTGHAAVIEALDSVFGSLIYKPNPAKISGGCANLPLDVSRDDMRAVGARVFFVGNCRAGWSADVFGWDANHVESGSTPNYKAFPACDATYNRGVYASKLVRYYEDSTWLSAFVDPSETPADHEADALTPAKVSSMIACGVNLFGFDQFDPNDGRINASLWSWATDEPKVANGDCSVMRADGRWAAADCGVRRPAACRAGDGSWALSPAVPAVGAEGACHATGGRFAVPRTGEENAALRAVAGGVEVSVAAPR